MLNVCCKFQSQSSLFFILKLLDHWSVFRTNPLVQRFNDVIIYAEIFAISLDMNFKFFCSTFVTRWSRVAFVKCSPLSHQNM